MAPFVPYILDRYPRHACCSDSVEEKEQAEWIWKTNEDKWMPRRVATCDGDKTLRCPRVCAISSMKTAEAPPKVTANRAWIYLDNCRQLSLGGELETPLKTFGNSHLYLTLYAPCLVPSKRLRMKGEDISDGMC